MIHRSTYSKSHGEDSCECVDFTTTIARRRKRFTELSRVILPAAPARPHADPPGAEPYGDGRHAVQHQIASKLIRHFMASEHRVSVKWPRRGPAACAEYTYQPNPHCARTATRQIDMDCPLAIRLSWRSPSGATFPARAHSSDHEKFLVSLHRGVSLFCVCLCRASSVRRTKYYLCCL